MHSDVVSDAHYVISQFGTNKLHLFYSIQFYDILAGELQISVDRDI